MNLVNARYGIKAGLKAYTHVSERVGRYGYRRNTALLRRTGWDVNHKRVERIWRREGLKAPAKQPRRGRLWLNDGSCIRLRREQRNHVWAYGFVLARLNNRRPVRLLPIIDEYTRKCLTIRAQCSIRSTDVIEIVTALMAARGVPEHIRSDNGPEFAARVVWAWLSRVGARTLYIEPGSPWENRYVESFNGKLRDELLNPGFLHAAGGADADRTIPADLPPGKAAHLPGIQACGAGNHSARGCCAGAGRANIGSGTTIGGRSPCYPRFLPEAAGS